MKYEWRKAEKAIYGVKASPTLVTVPDQTFIMIDGEGNPNSSDFSERVSALYSLVYTIMIAQPEFITREMVEKALAKVKVKKPNLHYDEIRFERMDEGNSIAMLHVGPFDDEPQTFAKMDAFCQENGLKRCMNYHREIYLNNKNRTTPQKLKTILRYRVQ